MPRHFTRNDSGLRRNHIYTTLVVLSLLALCATGLHQPAAQAAAAFTVNSTGDGADSNTADGVCDDGSGDCTLRAAVEQANQSAGDDTINITVTGTINLSSELPRLSNLTITGPGLSQLTVRRNPAAARFRIFTTSFNSTVSISGLTISGGRASGPSGGGGILNSQGATLTLSDVVVRGNSAEVSLFSFSGHGGGIFHEGVSLTLTHSTVSGNSAADGLSSSTQAGGDGGGIYAHRGILSVINSTISGNEAGDGGGGSSGAVAGDGGGLFISGAAVTLANSTVSGNSAGNGPGGGGGGISGGEFTLDSCTVASNKAPGGGSRGGGVSGFGVKIRNSIVANNTAGFDPDVSGTLKSQDYNLIRDTTGATISGVTAHNLTGVDPLLGALQTNQAWTQEHALLPGSPAIDAGDSGGLTTDQRGFARPVDNASAANASDGADIGAYEAQTPPAAGQLQFSAASYSAAEGAGAAVISVTRVGGSAGAVTVTFSTADGSTAAGADYTAVSGFTVAFADGDAATKTVQVPVNDDTSDETDETVKLYLMNPTGGVALVGTPAEATLTILDNDSLPSLSVGDVSVTEGDAGTTPANFVVSLSGPSGKTVSVTYTSTTFGANATGGDDFTPVTGRLSFAPGETSKTVTVLVRGDAHVETDETYFFDLTDADNATVSVARGHGTIVNDDSPATKSVQFSGTSFPSGEGGGTVTIITIYRTGDLAAEASVDYSTSDGTAKERGDYMSAFGRLKFAPHSSFASLTLLITNDRYSEEEETFTVALSNPSGVTLGAGSTATVAIRDDDTADGPSPVALGPGFDASFFVRQHYRDFLGREPDSSGLQFWFDEIEKCGADQQCREVKRIHVSAAFFLSIEFQETGFLSYRARKAAFGNLAGKPVPVAREEMLRDMQGLGSELVVNAPGWEQKLEQNKQAYFEQLTSSGRFAALYPQSLPAEQFVDALNANAGGALSKEERDALVVGLQANSKTRAQALRAVAEDADFASAEKNRAFVLMQYFGYLRRDPDSAPDSDFSGYDFWLSKLNEFNGDFIGAEMVKAFISSDEYRKRFGL
ncbi:MAG: Calx-beta domain-containing protein [Pyrinomonadaceae bacterium]